VIRDEIFGVIGFGCRTEVGDDGSLTVFPDNGVDERVYVEAGIAVESECPLGCVAISSGGLHVEIEAAVGGAGRANIIVRGLSSDIRSITSDGSVAWSADGDGNIHLSAGIDGARELGVVRITIVVG
jgi:hypothetical protein